MMSAFVQAVTMRVVQKSVASLLFFLNSQRARSARLKLRCCSWPVPKGIATVGVLRVATIFCVSLGRSEEGAIRLLVFFFLCAVFFTGVLCFSVPQGQVFLAATSFFSHKSIYMGQEKSIGGSLRFRSKGHVRTRGEYYSGFVFGTRHLMRAGSSRHPHGKTYRSKQREIPDHVCFQYLFRPFSGRVFFGHPIDLSGCLC